MTITCTTGDATQPVGDGPKIIAHIVNDEGGWGRGFVVALSERWPQPERDYRAWHKRGIFAQDLAGNLNPFCLGAVQLVLVDTHQQLWVANMVAQQGIRHSPDAPPAVDYDALALALAHVSKIATYTNATVHMPRIGCGLGGGSWDKIEAIINDTLVSQGIAVTVYDLPERN